MEIRFFHLDDLLLLPKMPVATRFLQFYGLTTRARAAV